MPLRGADIAELTQGRVLEAQGQVFETLEHALIQRWLIGICKLTGQPPLIAFLGNLLQDSLDLCSALGARRRIG